jgi:DNA repair protein RecN (Recombination protein N)
VLTELRIRNLAIIDALTLPLSGGLTVLTGETGTGKSIIIGALGLLLGERASADLIRTGADRASVEGTFDLAGRDELLAMLDARGVSVENDMVVLKREISSAGRARCWINGTACTTAMLADVGRALVNLHGQHEAQTLLEASAQREILDAFGGASGAAAAVRQHFDALSLVTRELNALQSRRTEAEKQSDYLRHVASEIDAARLEPGEETRLEDEAKRLEHAEELKSLAETMAANLDDGEAAILPRLAHVQRSLAAIQRIDASLERLQELYDAAFYALEELATALGAYAQAVDLDPSRLEEVHRRRDLIFSLIKKYGPTLNDVIERGRQARTELELVDAGSLDLRELEARRSAVRVALGQAAAVLSERRRVAADRLARDVDALLPELGMPDGHLAVSIVPRAESGPDGAEDVEFRVAMNVGHESRPLARVASGGELSRVMLALKTILARLDGVPTLVFDEVDVGIGGRVALQVGDLMRAVAAHHQVLAVTHLPQIAARAHQHIVVSKGARDGITTADTHAVKDEARVIEVARMLGGDPESEASLAHARELLGAAAPPRGRRRARA